MEYMDDVEQRLKATIKKASGAVRAARSSLPGDPAEKLEKIAEQVSQPCIVAVVGEVKAGKSTFINALLREDLARVGRTETTATINYFRYSKHQPAENRTVRCFYSDGHDEYVDRAFLDALQGNDVETLRRAAEIDHLEYYLHNRSLEYVTLVDTPGTGASIPEHQQVTDEFLRLHQQLRAQHDKETRQLEDTADAIIYLLGVAASANDQNLLENFRQFAHGESVSFNAVGVLSKIDLYPEAIERRKELAQKIAIQLEEQLATVVPVSAEIRRALDALLLNNRAGLKQLCTALQSITPGKFSKFFAGSGLYLRVDPDWPLTVEQRNAVRGKAGWRAFATIASVIVQHAQDLDAIGKELNAIAGFDQLRAELEQHIFQRSRLLRCYNKVKEARQVLSHLRFLAPTEKHDDEGQQRQTRLLAFIQQAYKVSGDAASAWEIDALVRESLRPQVEALEPLVARLDSELADIFHELKQYSEDFGALQKMRKSAHLFTPEQIDELQALFAFGALGLDDQRELAYVKERQMAWRHIHIHSREPVCQAVADQAVTRYGLIQQELEKGT